MWKKLFAGYNSWNLGHKLLGIFLLVSVLPILIVQIFAFQVTGDTMRGKIDELMVSNLTQIAERVNLNLQVYSNLLYQIYKDDEIIRNLELLADEENTHKAVAYNQIVKRLKQYNNSERGIRCLCIVCPDGSSVVYDFETDSSLNTIWSAYRNMQQIPPYRETIDAAGMVISDTMRFADGENKGQFFHISKRLFDFDRLDRGSIGTVTMTVDQKVLGEICGGGTASDRSLNFIVNENRLVIAYPDADFSGIVINPDLNLEQFVVTSGFLRDRKLAVNSYEDPLTGWTYCNVYDSDYMRKDISGMQKIQAGITVLVLLFATILLTYLVRDMDSSVQSVVFGMQEVQKGNLDVVVPEQSFREIGIIADNFNDMTVKVRQLIREVGEAKEQQKNAEIRALEAQINPHFLYNTLDSINWMAIEKEEYEISRMLRNLGVILRYSVNKSNQLVTVREAEDWLGKYISLQQMRFNDAFECKIHVEKETYPVLIHKLLLQPFLENAIIHGFKEMEYGGLLQVDIAMAEERRGLIVIIEDNGKGMPPEVAASFNNKEEAIRDDGRSIGLHNAFSRMHMYYGDEASWQVNSILGRGTVITIRLPIIKSPETVEATEQQKSHMQE